MILMAITSKGSIVDVERVREGKSVVSTEIIHWFSEDVVRVVFEGVHSRDLSFIGCRRRRRRRRRRRKSNQFNNILLNA